MRRSPIFLFGILLFILFYFLFPSPYVAYANVLGNPSFEVSIGDSAVNWDDTNGSTRITTPPAGFDAFPDGSAALLTDAASDYTFQTHKNVQPSDLVVFSAQVESSVAADGASGGQLRIEFQRLDPATGVAVLISAVNSALLTTDNAPNGGADGYTLFTISQLAPAATAQVTFVLRRQGAGAGNVVFDGINAEINPVKLTLSASKTTVRAGEVVTVVADFVNASAQNQISTRLVVENPAGLDVLRDTVRVNGAATPFSEGSTLITTTPNLRTNDRTRVVFQVLVTTGVSPGHLYEIKASILAAARVSQSKSIFLRVVNDPLFDEGTILGKIFDDRNEDGMQQKGEAGVPRVRLYTEYGVGIVTDKDGRFHIPAVRPGRHILKIDGHTLPPGTRFLTEESLLVKSTPGLLSKVKFAVRLPESALPEEYKKDLQIWVTQGIDLTQPELRVAIDPDLLKTGLGRLERRPAFKIKTNYSEFIDGWRLEVIDEMGEKVWSGIGISKPPIYVPWDGTMDSGEPIGPGIYGYRLKVQDAKDHEDRTPLQFFRVVRKTDFYESGEKPLEIPAVGAFEVFRDGKRSIPLTAKPSIRVYGKTQPGREVKVGGVPAEAGPTGEFEQEFFVTPGEKKIMVSATDPKGETVSVEEKITVKDSLFFMVALGEEELGGNFSKVGNFETTARDDAFHEGFYHDGRLAYYLKAKLRGKFLVKSRYDTGDKRTELFTHLDPDDYYPVYGDYSEIEYEGQDTRERLFILVEMDRSFLKWGSYETRFTDTELSRYHRTLSGLKIHHETLSSTKYGDAKRGITLFGAKASYLADHNEFRGTGGSLYYLRQQNVLQGSEKVRIEIRDKIQDIPTESRNLVAGKDYEIDYLHGRILLKEPLSSVSASETIISNDILEGNAVYLIVDYEFESHKIQDDHAAGIRGYTHVGDHIRIGGTAVEEKRSNVDYDLRGVDMSVKVGRNTRIIAELAESKHQQVRQATSFNGGLSFHSQSPVGFKDPRDTAYLIKVESKPIEKLETSAYVQSVKPGFSVDRIKSQEGFRKHGLQARLRLTDSFYLLGRHDVTQLASELRPVAERGITASLEKIRSTTGQAVFEAGPWKVIGEYLHQALDIPTRNRIDSIFSELDFAHAFGLKVSQKVTEWLTPYMRAQYAFDGENNYQAGGGLEAKMGERTSVFFEEMMGEAGDSTQIAIHHQHDEKTTSYASIKSRDRGFGARQVSTAVGSSHQLSDHSRVYSERQYSTYSGSVPLSLAPSLLGQTAVPGLWSSDIYGYETQFWDRWDLGFRFERRHLDASDFRNLNDEATTDLVRTNTFNALVLTIGYNDNKNFRWSSEGEVRIEPDSPEVRQWVTQNFMDYRITQDLSFLGRANFGTSRFLETDNLTGRFVEVNLGFAFRPVETDRLNALGKYTFLHEESSDAQFLGDDGGTVETDDEAHILALEAGYDLNRWFELVEKTAYRLGKYKTALTDSASVGTFLWVNRFNYRVTRKWDLGLEYRMLIQGRAGDSFKHGPLVELDRELYDYIRLGIGYNFTDFDDDLRRINDYKKNAFFFRVSGKV